MSLGDTQFYRLLHVASRNSLGLIRANAGLHMLVMETNPDARARETEEQMTDSERFSLLVSAIGTPGTPGISRLDVPALRSTDDDLETKLPAPILIGATFNPALARQSGALIGREARMRGFNLARAGGINLQGDARNGRNFEYYAEDPLLSAVLGAEAVNGIQEEAVISTLKYFAIANNETNRRWLEATIDVAVHRESELLAFQIAIERSQPGAIITARNKINGEYASGNSYLLNDVLKGAWRYKGWVMSPLDATVEWQFALNGLDQPFGESLRQAYADGKLPKERLSDMVRRILRSMYAVGIDKPHPAEVDMAGSHETALATARQGVVLLKNKRALPLSSRKALRIAVIGGRAYEDVPTGGRPSAVRHLLASPPITKLKELLPKAQIEFDPGVSPTESAKLAEKSDVAIVFGIRVEGEGDLTDLSLPFGQDAVIDAVATANTHTIVVLETGNPVAMPWRDRVQAIVQTWYPGQTGGQAIAEVLTGKVNPSGRLPMTFPADLARTPRPDEGGEVGYRWFARKDEKPLYSFGHGLSYTRFAYSDFKVSGGETITADFTVTNTGKRAGSDVPQLYLTHAPRDKRVRLLGFQRVDLRPGESQRVTMTADPRLLATFDVDEARWRTMEGIYRLALGRTASDFAITSATNLTPRLFGV